MEIVADFNADGSFYQINKTPYGQQEFRGRYGFNGTLLQIQPIGFPVQQIGCRFADSETVILSYPTGEVIQARRVKTSAQTSPAPSSRNQTPTGTTGPTSSNKPVRLLLQRVWEANEKAFTVLVPKGWKTVGGVFNVNPLKTNGPGVDHFRHPRLGFPADDFHDRGPGDHLHGRRRN